MNRPFPQIAGSGALFRFPGGQGLTVQSIEDALRRAFQRSETALSMGVADWHRGTSLGVLAAAPDVDMSRLLPVFARLGQTLHESSMLAADSDTIDDMVLDLHRGRVVVRTVRGTPFLLWAFVPGATACCEGVRTDLRGLALEFGGVVPRVRSAFDS